MRFWDIRESTTSQVENFQIEWLPSAAFDYVTPKIRTTRSGNKAVELEAGPYVGTLSLENGDVLRILPRVGEKAFWRMLLLSEGLDDLIRKEFEQLAAASFDEEGAAPWQSLLIRSFIAQLRIIEKNSLLPARHRVTKRLGVARGKVQLLKTLTTLQKREPIPVFCTFKEKTYDTAEHRVLAAAAGRLVNTGLVDSDGRVVAIRWAQKATRTLVEAEFQTVLNSLRSNKYTGPRSYYIAALTMARLLLADAGISFEEQRQVGAETTLTNVRTLFERYIRAIVRNALYDHGFVVEKRDDHAHTLFDDGTCALIPDVLISDASGPQLIIDAKYKVDRAVVESDYYQMATYLAAYGVTTGILVMPTSQPNMAPVVNRRAVTGVTIVEIRIPLDDWTATEGLVTTEVRRLLGVNHS